MRRAVSLAVLVATTATVAIAGEPEARTISWQQLQPVVEFEDPF